MFLKRKNSNFGKNYEENQANPEKNDTEITKKILLLKKKLKHLDQRF